MRPHSAFSKRTVVAFVFAFAIIGALIFVAAKAAGNSMIMGQTFQDSNRNGLFDNGEPVMANQHLFFYKSDGTYMGNVYSDSSGAYTFGGLDDGSYLVQYAPDSWWPIRYSLVPTTTNSNLPKITVQLASTARADFGWRTIVRSTDTNAPISSYAGPNGLLVRSYDDVVPAKSIFDDLENNGLLVNGLEAKFTDIRFDFAATGSTSTSVSGSPGNYTNFHATSNIGYEDWLANGDGGLFHEYGHAWSLYNAYITQQDPTMASYLQARGLSGDSRVNSSYAWNVREMIAEDYRQLFGPDSAQNGSQINTEIPLAATVPGLKDFLQNTYTEPPTGGGGITLSAPTNLTASATSTPSGPAVVLNWSDSNSGAIDHYDIYRDGQKIGFVNSPSTTYTDVGLLSETNYSYYLKAIDTNGVGSPASATVTVTTVPPDTSPPSAPTNLRLLSATKSSISLIWNVSTDNVGVNSYQIYSVTVSKGKQLSTLVGSTPNTSFSMTGLKANTSHSYFVIALDSAGNKSNPSAVLTVKTTK